MSEPTLSFHWHGCVSVFVCVAPAPKGENGGKGSCLTEVGEPLVRARLQADHTQGWNEGRRARLSEPPLCENSKRQIRVDCTRAFKDRYVL